MAEELHWSGFICTCEAMGKTILTILMIGLLSDPALPEIGIRILGTTYQLVAGQAVEVKESNVKVEKGIFVGFADQFLTIHTQQQNLVSPRTQISEIRLRPRRAGRNTWIGAGVEAAAGFRDLRWHRRRPFSPIAAETSQIYSRRYRSYRGSGRSRICSRQSPQHCLQGTLIYR
jgi:hypothetical protein